jgi:hypothetical protein
MEKLQTYADANGYFWSCGTSPDFKYLVSIWKSVVKDGKIHPFGCVCKHCIKLKLSGEKVRYYYSGFGNTLAEAIEMCISKPKLVEH